MAAAEEGPFNEEGPGRTGHSLTSVSDGVGSGGGGPTGEQQRAGWQPQQPRPSGSVHAGGA